MKTLTLLIALSLPLMPAFLAPSASAGLHATDMAVRSHEACAAIPSEPLEDPDVESADYGVGLVFREYDLDGDGRPDFMTATQVDVQGPTGALRPTPLFYWIDLNADATYDQVWIDQGGQGRCYDMMLYQGAVEGKALLPLYTELAPR